MADVASHAYFDTSALVKRYVVESGSRTARRWMQTRAVVSSALLPVEVTSALARRRREGRISAAMLSRLLRRVQADRDSWELVPVSDEILDAAGRCLVDHSLRTLDAIHLASAHRLHREGLELPFVTADARQASAARSLGLEVADASR